MGRVSVDQKSLDKYIESFEKEQNSIIEAELRARIQNGESITVASLPKRMKELNDSSMERIDRRVTRIIERETSKIRYKRSQKKMIDVSDIKRSYGVEKIPQRGYGRFNTSRGSDKEYEGTYIKQRDSHGFYEYRLRNIVSRERRISYWFGSIPGRAEGLDKGRNGIENQVPIYASSQINSLYQPSKYAEEYPQYVYMPYIASAQPAAKDYVYWTDPRVVIGVYKRDVRDKNGNVIHKSGDPMYARFRSVGDKKGKDGKVDRTWHNKADEGYISKIIKNINKIATSKKKKKMPIVDLNLKRNSGVMRDGDVEIEYVVSVRATGDKRYK